MAYINPLRNYNTSLYFTLEFSPGGVANHVTRMIFSTFTPYSCNDIDEIALDTIHVMQKYNSNKPTSKLNRYSLLQI